MMRVAYEEELKWMCSMTPCFIQIEPVKFSEAIIELNSSKIFPPIEERES